MLLRRKATVITVDDDDDLEVLERDDPTDALPAKRLNGAGAGAGVGAGAGAGAGANGRRQNGYGEDHGGGAHCLSQTSNTSSFTVDGGGGEDDYDGRGGDGSVVQTAKRKALDYGSLKAVRATARAEIDLSHNVGAGAGAGMDIPLSQSSIFSIEQEGSNSMILSSSQASNPALDENENHNPSQDSLALCSTSSMGEHNGHVVPPLG